MAEALNISKAEALGVVSFYHDFRRSPIDGRVLKLCRAESCQAMGCEDLVAHLEVAPRNHRSTARTTAADFTSRPFIASAIARFPPPRCSTASRSAVSTATASTRSSRAPREDAMSARVFVPGDSSALVGRRRRGRRRDSERSARAAASTLRSSAPGRAASSGWSRSSKSKRPPGESAIGPVAAEDVAHCSTRGFWTGGSHPKALGPRREISPISPGSSGLFLPAAG